MFLLNVKQYSDIHLVAIYDTTQLASFLTLLLIWDYTFGMARLCKTQEKSFMVSCLEEIDTKVYRGCSLMNNSQKRIVDSIHEKTQF